jgi:FO synthase subunit 1
MTRRRLVTFSKACTIVPTYECFNRCTYCNFRKDASGWISLSKAAEIARTNRDAGATEALVLSGEVHPKSSLRRHWIAHTVEICKVAIQNGLLPHVNVGPLSWGEMKELTKFSVSMGLMLEQVTDKLMASVHRRAPSKDPSLRIEQLHLAGQLKIPFTTGILVGLGEEECDWETSLNCIAAVHNKYGHIQECIIQPFRPGDRGYISGPKLNAFHSEALPYVVSLARKILPTEIAIQIPPNLVLSETDRRKGLELVFRCLEAGASDLGGISPVDEVNPTYAFPSITWLREVLLLEGFELMHRLPIYEQYIPWIQKAEKFEHLQRLFPVYKQGNSAKSTPKS